MPARKKEIENELVVTSVRSKGDMVILDLRFTKPRSKEPSERQLESVIETLPKSQMERVGKEVAKGYMAEVQKQIRASTQSLSQFLPPTPSPDTIQIILSKQEYEELGRPRVFDKLTLKLRATKAHA